MERFRIATQTGRILALFSLLLGFALGAAETNQSRHARSEAFFNGPIPKLKIEISGPSVAALQRDNRHYVRVTVHEGDQVYKDVGAHLKGAAGSFRSLDQNPSLTLNFDKFVKGQDFHGLDKVHLNNSIQDQSLLSYNLCAELFRRAGVPAARVGYARVELNGRNLGLYVLVEGYDRTFLKHHFKDPDGNFYDGGFLREVGDGLQKISGANPREQSDLKALFAAATEPDVAKRYARLQQVLDVDRFASYLAIEVITWDWDGYPMNRNNYRLYHDPSTDKIIFLPHGMDQMFWEANGPLIPGMRGLVATAFMQTPEGRTHYMNRLSELSTNAFDLKLLTDRLFALEKKIRPAIAEYNPNAAAHQASMAVDFQNKMTARSRSLAQQLASRPKPLKFDANNLALLPPWEAKPDRISPNGARMERTAASDGKKFLRIAATGDGKCVGSWRVKVFLEPGPYHFEVMASTKDVSGLNDQKGDGAGIRISGTKEPRTNKLDGTSTWKKLEYDFTVPPVFQDVELVCELRAQRGEALFAADSLKLIRRK